MAPQFFLRKSNRFVERGKKIVSVNVINLKKKIEQVLESLHVEKLIKDSSQKSKIKHNINDIVSMFRDLLVRTYQKCHLLDDALDSIAISSNQSLQRK